MVGFHSSFCRGWAACFAALAFACTPGPPEDGTPCTRWTVGYDTHPIGPPPMDVLFVLDESEATAAARMALAEELPRLVESLDTGVAPSGRRFAAPGDVHFGIVTADMGGPDCESEDGVLQDALGCGVASWLDFAFDDDVGEVSERGQCLLDTIGGTCRVAQPLEAALKALTPSTADLVFAGGRVGHGDGENAGFLRPRSTLVIVTLTRGDDCSAADPELFRPDSVDFSGSLERRCMDYPGALHPVERFVDGLLTLREDDPAQLYVMPVGGVPLDLLPDPERALAPQVETMLADPRLELRPDPSDPESAMPSCTSGALGAASPPRRLLETAAGLDDRGAFGLVGSTCGDDLDPAIDELLEALARPYDAWCLFPPRPRRADGRIQCTLVELIDPDAIERCEDLPGRTSAGVDEDIGRLRCRVHQVALGADHDPIDPSEATGWFYDDFSEFLARYCAGASGRIAWVGEAAPTEGGRIRLACHEASFVAPPGVGEPCDGPCATPPETSELFGTELTCEPISATCLPGCTSAVGCIDGWTCLDVDGDGEGYCVNASCP